MLPPSASPSVQATDTNLSCAGVVLVKPSDLSYGPGVWQGVVRAGCDGGAHLEVAVVCCCCVGSDRAAGVVPGSGCCESDTPPDSRPSPYLVHHG